MEHVDIAALAAHTHGSGCLAFMQADLARSATGSGMRVQRMPAQAAFVTIIARAMPPRMPPKNLASFSISARSAPPDEVHFRRERRGLKRRCRLKWQSENSSDQTMRTSLQLLSTSCSLVEARVYVCRLCIVFTVNRDASAGLSRPRVICGPLCAAHQHVPFSRRIPPIMYIT